MLVGRYMCVNRLSCMVKLRDYVMTCMTFKHMCMDVKACLSLAGPVQDVSHVLSLCKARCPCQILRRKVHVAIVAYIQVVSLASQCSLHNAPIFRLLLKVAVNGTHQCESLNFCGALCPNTDE